jgi:hypothetical protein
MINGHLTRVFSFPALPLGSIDWTNHYSAAPEAKNHVWIPAECQVKLTIKPPLGRLTLRYPKILASIGAEDINELVLESLDVSEDVDGPGRKISINEIQPQFFEAIEGWRALKILRIHNFKIGDKAIAALDQIYPVPKLLLNGTLCSGEALSHLKWLDQVRRLDLKALTDINPILLRLSGSSALVELYIDQTEPSAVALAGLAACRNLRDLEANGCNIDDQKLEAICRIKSLHILNVSNGVFSSASLQKVAQIKGLEKLVIKSCRIDAGDIAALQKQMPGLRIFEK